MGIYPSEGVRWIFPHFRTGFHVDLYVGMNGKICVTAV